MAPFVWNGSLRVNPGIIGTGVTQQNYESQQRISCNLCFGYNCSVQYIEGAATKLLEKEGVVTGVQYKEKGSNETKVLF